MGYDVESIVEPFKPVQAEETLRLWRQVVKFQLRLDETLGVQLVLDRVHRYHPRESKPLGYLHFKDVGALLELAKQSLACACILTLNGREGSPVERAVDGALELIRNDVVRLVKTGLEELRRKVREREV